MKIAIDTTALLTLHAKRGIGRYTKNLIDALEKFVPEVKIIPFAKDKIPKADIVHFTYLKLLDRPHLVQYKKNTIFTIHDIIPVLFTKRFHVGFRQKIWITAHTLLLKNISGVITDSHKSKNDIITYLHLSSKKVHTVYLAPFHINKKCTSSLCQNKVKTKYVNASSYILYVGDINWNKNVEGLIYAFSKVSKNFPHLRLVLVSYALIEGNSYEAIQIYKLIEKLSLTSKIIITGYISDHDLMHIYQMSSLYVQPSFYEGFGLPVLEAFSQGTLVVSSREGSLPEVVGDGGLYFNPYNIDDMVDTIQKALTLSDNKRKQILKKASIQLKRFSWKKTARDTYHVYKKLWKV